jgi:aldehyde:ferredoxin oxidoreductase
MGKFLVIDLDTGTTATLPLSDELKTAFIGGKGFCAKLLYDLVPEDTDPFSSENVLMFLTGPLTATSAPSMRGVVATKSPLTGTYLDSFFGGHFAPSIKYAGYDGIIIKGKARELCYIAIEDDTVAIKSAARMQGLGTLETLEAVKAELGDPGFKVASIGPAGENGVLYALIGCEHNRQAGRGGAGAVMGAKNIKAVAVKGSKLVKVKDPRKFMEAVQAANEELRNSPDVQGLVAAGTAMAVDFANEAGILPSKNYQRSTFAKASNLGDEGQRKHLWIKSSACLGCPIRCTKMGAVRTGKYKGTITDIVEYESAALMGSNLEISDIRACAYLVTLCDELGLDSMSAASSIAFAMEAGEKKILDTEETALEFGNVATVEYLLQAIAERRSGLGRLLARGVKRAAEIIGKDSDVFAVHVKGMEAPAWGPRGVSGMGLAYMTADRGGCHQRAFPVAYEVGGEKWQGKTLDPTGVEGKGELVFHLQNYQAGTDTLTKCDFGGFGVSPATYADLLEAATGLHLDPKEFDTIGERIWNVTRLFNLREGIDPTQDTLPKRFVNEALEDGPAKGHRISKEDMHFMLQEYYRARGWTERGIPTKATLVRLGQQAAGI